MQVSSANCARGPWLGRFACSQLWLLPNQAWGKFPVMLWIHGGAFTAGSGSQAEFSGVQFAKQDVILVTCNYRLGCLGFFAFPACFRRNSIA